uniref:Single-stranded DNA binding protein Ssb-like OB fold domain-containing protein n=1 Tax=Arcella intermedia TaxID=1963864 RepID=A0A6B2LQ11_9EUKA
MKSLNIQCIVLEKIGSAKTNNGELVTQVLVADHSGAVILSVWDELGDLVKTGDILQLRGGYSSIHKNELKLYVGKHGVLERTGEFMMAFIETPNISKYKWTPEGTLITTNINEIRKPQVPAGRVPPNTRIPM